MTTKSTRRAQLTQRLVNAYPSWSAVRNDIQSVGFQFFNAIGGSFDDLIKQVRERLATLHLATSPVGDLDTTYKVRLAEDFVFTKESDNDMEENYLPPVVSGQVGSVYYSISLAEDNSIENFCRSALPTRLELIETLTGNDAQYLVASGFAFESPLKPLMSNGEIPVPSRLYVGVDGAEQYIGISDTNEISRGLIQIEGESKYGVELTEELVFLHDDKQPTLNEFAIVSGVYARGIVDIDNAYIRVKSMDFNNGPYLAAYQLEYDKNINEDVPSFWNIGVAINPSESTLDYLLYQHPEIEVRVGGFSDTYQAIRQGLRDSLGNTVSANDMAVQEYSDYLWVIDNSRLFCYSSLLPYMSLKSLKGRSEYRSCKIETDGDYVIKGDTLTLEFIWVDPSKGILKHQVLAEHSNGTKYAITGGSLVAYNPAVEYWEYGEPRSRYLQAPVELVLPEAGLYTFSLYVVLGDETVEIDKRVVSYDVYQTPLVELSLTSLGVIGTATGIHIDTDGYIWVLDNAGKVYKILRHYDTMLVDYKEKTVYFRENYDWVYIEEGEE